MRMAIVYLNNTERVKINSGGGLEAEALVEGIGWVVRNEIPDVAILKGLIAASEVIASNIQKFS